MRDRSADPRPIRKADRLDCGLIRRDARNRSSLPLDGLDMVGTIGTGRA